MAAVAESNAVAALQTENARLAALLDAHGIKWRLPPSLASQLVPALPACEQDPESPRSSLTTFEKVALFRRLFRGRTDVFPVRWEGKTSGKSGYAPACGNEWRAGVCEKPRVKCGDKQPPTAAPAVGCGDLRPSGRQAHRGGLSAAGG